MLTVTIAVNGKTVFERTAVNRGAIPGSPGWFHYALDNGKYLDHLREDGAVMLASQILTEEMTSHPEKYKATNR